MKLVPESLNEVNFERGIKNTEDLRDRLFGKIIKVDLDAMSVLVKEDSNGDLQFDLSDEDTQYFFETATSKGAKVRPTTKNTPMGVMVEMIGTKEQLIPALHMWDPNGRTLEDFEIALDPWEGGDDLWEYMDPEY